MLSDSQIDELERLIVFSNMDDLPLVLGRAIPILFAELRMVRATLDSKVNAFLQGGTSDASGLPEGKSHAGTDSQSPQGVSGGNEFVGLDDSLPGNRQPQHDQGLAGGHPETIGEPGNGPKRKRGRPKGSRNKSKLGAGGGQQEVGGSVRGSDSGVSGLLPIQAPEGHGREGRVNE